MRAFLLPIWLLAFITPSFGSPLGGRTAAPALSDWECIYNTISLYSLAVDFNQSSHLFPQIFAPNAFCNYTSDSADLSDLHGLKNIIAALGQDGLKFNAQHLLGTVRIEFDEHNPNKANASSYALTTAFGRGATVNQTATFYGIYRDTFERIHGLGWRITTRYFNQLGPASGNLAVV